MKWVSLAGRHGPEAGWVDGETVVVLGPEPLEYWLERGAADARAAGGARLDLADAALLAPILAPGKILGIGLNYAAHAAESVSFAKTGADGVQKWFNKQSSAVNAPHGEVALPAVSDELDYEGELVVVIAKPGRHVPRERAMEIVAGFAVGCDYSVRDWQRASPTMIMGKGFDTHAPFGPWITSPDEVGDVSRLTLSSWVNGELRQHAHAGDMIHDIPAQIAHLTAAFTLQPGDVIFTGTPAGVGAGFDPPRFLKAGDRVRVEIDGLGHIEHRIVPEDGETRIG